MRAWLRCQKAGSFCPLLFRRASPALPAGCCKRAAGASAEGAACLAPCPRSPFSNQFLAGKGGTNPARTQHEVYFPDLFLPPLCSFKDCIPRSFYRQIQQNNYLTKFRMKTVFKKFVQRFQRHTVSAGKLTEQDIMYKYLATLEHLAPRFGSELYPVLSLETSSEGEKAPLYVNGGHAPAEHGHALLPRDPPVTHEVLVTGTSGIQWRPVPPEVG